MGYFSNGSEGMDYEEQFCRRCIHYGPEEGPGCPVWLAHLMFNYEECNRESNAHTMLDMLIPRDDAVGNLECAMFVEQTAVSEPGRATSDDGAAPGSLTLLADSNWCKRP